MVGRSVLWHASSPWAEEAWKMSCLAVSLALASLLCSAVASLEKLAAVAYKVKKGEEVGLSIIREMDPAQVLDGASIDGRISGPVPPLVIGVMCSCQ